MAKKNIDKDLEYLIPSKVKIVLGRKDPQEFEIEPELSIKTQIKDLPNLIAGFIKMVSESMKQKAIIVDEEETGTIESEDQVSSLVSLIGNCEDEIVKLFTMLTGVDDKDTILDSTNAQLVYALEIVYNKNYGEPGKKCAALFQGLKTAFGSQK